MRSIARMRGDRIAVLGEGWPRNITVPQYLGRPRDSSTVGEASGAIGLRSGPDIRRLTLWAFTPPKNKHFPYRFSSRSPRSSGPGKMTVMQGMMDQAACAQ